MTVLEIVIAMIVFSGVVAYFNRPTEADDCDDDGCGCPLCAVDPIRRVWVETNSDCGWWHCNDAGELFRCREQPIELTNVVPLRKSA